MQLNEFYNRFFSDTVAGSSNQVLSEFESEKTFTGKIAYRLRGGGEYYSLLYSNIVDSTYDAGQISKANDLGNKWVINSLEIGVSDSLESKPQKFTALTFDGESTKTVSGNMTFCTDPVKLSACGGDYLHIKMNFTGSRFPYHREIVLNTDIVDQNGIKQEFSYMPVPQMIGSDREIENTVAFIGDSITQGCGTPFESYTHWVAKIAESLPLKTAVWDLGIGFAHGFDAATDGAWLYRAKMCREVNVCFGVNDIGYGRSFEQITVDLNTIIDKLKAAGCKVTLFTVPAFDYTGEKEKIRRKVNEYIKETLCKKVYRVFDMAKATGKEAPNDNMARFGGHPNSEGCEYIAQKYLE